MRAERAARDRCQFMMVVVRAASVNREIVGDGLRPDPVRVGLGGDLASKSRCDSGSNVKACLRTTAQCVWCVCVCLCTCLLMFVCVLRMLCVCVYVCLCVCVIAVAG